MMGGHMVTEYKIVTGRNLNLLQAAVNGFLKMVGSNRWSHLRAGG
jgi:hypothetical protein